MSVPTAPEVYKLAGAVWAVIEGIMGPTVASIHTIIPYSHDLGAHSDVP